jgi:hypothetical protein
MASSSINKGIIIITTATTIITIISAVISPLQNGDVKYKK